MSKNSSFDNALIEIMSQGLPLVSRPYARIAEQLGSSEALVIQGIQQILLRGVPRLQIV